jgi:hypothetical protein
MKKNYIEPVNIGLGKSNHSFLKFLAEELNIFKEMRDGYRYALAYSISQNLNPKEITEKGVTTFSLASIDPDGSFKSLIDILYPDIELPRYAILERLADAGMAELAKLHSNNQLDVDELLKLS